MVVSLPMTVESFTQSKQIQFVESVARAAEVAVVNVKIDKIESIKDPSRRLLAESIRVETSVKAVDTSTANSVANRLTPVKINVELEKAGLPKATMIEAPKTIFVNGEVGINTVSSPSAESSAFGASSMLIGAIVGGAVGALVIMALAVVVYRTTCKAPKASLHPSSTQYNQAQIAFYETESGYIASSNIVNTIQHRGVCLFRLCPSTCAHCACVFSITKNTIFLDVGNVQCKGLEPHSRSVLPPVAHLEPLLLSSHFSVPSLSRPHFSCACPSVLIFVYRIRDKLAKLCSANRRDDVLRFCTANRGDDVARYSRRRG